MNLDVTDLYEKLYSELLNWTVVMTGDYYEAQELVQEGFEKAMKNQEILKNLEFDQKRAWMYRTIKNLFIDGLRKRKRETLVDEAPDNAEPIDNGYSEIEWLMLFQSLPKDEGKILVLRYVEGLTSGQIGKLLGIPAGTVRSKLAEAKKHVREIISK